MIMVYRYLDHIRCILINNNVNESNSNTMSNSNQNVDCTMNYMTSSTPNADAVNLSLLNNAGSYLSDQMMLDHNNSTPNTTNNMFGFSPLHYHH